MTLTLSVEYLAVLSVGLGGCMHLCVIAACSVAVPLYGTGRVANLSDQSCPLGHCWRPSLGPVSCTMEARIMSTGLSLTLARHAD
jgi:hypothetical protein